MLSLFWLPVRMPSTIYGESLGQEFADSLRNAAYFTIHHRIAERLKSLGAGKVTIYDSAKDNIVQLIAGTAS